MVASSHIERHKFYLHLYIILYMNELAGKDDVKMKVSNRRLPKMEYVQPTHFIYEEKKMLHDNGK